MGRYASMLLASAVVGLAPLVAGCTERTPRVPESSVSTPPAPPAAESTSGVPVAAVESSAAPHPESPLLVYMRSRIGSTFPHVALVDERPTGYHGKEHIVVIRAMSTDSTYINFSINVVNEAMTEGVRSVEIMTAPWPDFTLRIDRVTPDSVYLTGRNARHHPPMIAPHPGWPTRV